MLTSILPRKSVELPFERFPTPRDPHRGVTLGGDKNYDTRNFVDFFNSLIVKNLPQEDPEGCLFLPPEFFFRLAQGFLMHGVPDLAGDFVQAQGLVDDVHLLQVKELKGQVPLVQHDDEAGGGMTETGAFQELLIVGLAVVGNDQVKVACFQGGQGFGHRVRQGAVLKTQEFDHRR